VRGTTCGRQNREAILNLSLEIDATEKITVICCKGRIVFGVEAELLIDEIEALFAQTRQIVIDLSEVELIDGAGLGALVSVALTARARKCPIKLAAPGDGIRRMLRLFNLASVFEVCSTLDAATHAFSKQPDPKIFRPPTCVSMP
jgi:anti-anti-sigma factor